MCQVATRAAEKVEYKKIRLYFYCRIPSGLVRLSEKCILYNGGADKILDIKNCQEDVNVLERTKNLVSRI